MQRNAEAASGGLQGPQTEASGGPQGPPGGASGASLSRGGAAAGVAAAISAGATDPATLRKVERCTEASCGQRSPEASLRRRLMGLRGPEPPDRLELGQSSWALLHRSAAVFPQEPTEAQQQRMKAWLGAFFKLYPCSECRTHIAPYVAGHPLQSAGSEGVCAWACEAHNFVNGELGKELFAPCEGPALRALYLNSQRVRRPEL